MDFLEIDAVPWGIQIGSAAIRFERIGAVERAWDGTLRSARRDLFFELNGLRTGPLTAAEAGVFMALDDAAFHTITGVWIGGASVQGLVEIDSMDTVPDGAVGFRFVVQFSIRTT